MGRRLSVVIPVFNEAENLKEMHSRLAGVLAELDCEVEIIFVDDGSNDLTPTLLTELHDADRQVKVVRFARNFGHQNAIRAGLDLAVGDAVIVMDGDLQDPPEAIPDLIQRWEEGYEVVYAVRERRLGERRFKTLQRKLYYRLLDRLAGIDIPVDAADFRLIDRRALDAFLQLRERNPYLRGMFSWIGFRQIGVPCDKAPRHAGKAKYSYRKLARLALDGVVSFSEAPLRLALVLGFCVSLTAFLLGVFALITRLVGVFVVPGWASILVVTSFLGGVQLLVLGLMGVYIGHIHDEVKARPLYIVRELRGFDVLGARSAASQSVIAHSSQQVARDS
jgi:polyisoprenyl-phosphate glycosyltransferase